MAEAETSVGLAHLLVEAAAGLPGAEQRLAAHLRPGLEPLLHQRLADAEPVWVADAGLLVQRHWQQLARIGDSVGAGPADAGTDAATGTTSGQGTGSGRKGAAGSRPRKGAKVATATKGAKAAKGAKGTKDANAARSTESGAAAHPGGELAADAGTSPLYASFVEQAAAVMQGLVHEAARRAEPDGPAQRALRALEALDSLDPPLARVARLRWFAGLDNGAVARLLGEGEPDAQRLWLKARAFLSAATKGVPTPSP